MIEKMATEGELFLLGGEIDKPSNYDINRCVTKTRSKQFKTINPNLTAYQDLQLIPVSLFGKVIMSDTVQIVFEHEKDSIYNNLHLDIVLVADGKEIHYKNTFHTYDWTYDNSFVKKEEETDTANNKNTIKYNIDLKKVKELIGNTNNARIQLKAKWYNVIPQNQTIHYFIKLFANSEEKYSNLNSINLLTHEYFPVDVFFRKIFEVAYNRSNDVITILDNAEPDKSAILEYNLLIKKNSNIIVNKHLKTNSYYGDLQLFTKDINKGDIITLDIRNFMIKLSTYDGIEKTIIPKITKTKVSSKIKNGCRLSVLKNDIDHYVAQVEILEDLPKNKNEDSIIFYDYDLTLINFDSVYSAFQINLHSINLDSYYRYYDTSNDVQGMNNDIKLFI